jgi:probable FeS assembly SUF system protein SufT
MSRSSPAGRPRRCQPARRSWLPRRSAAPSPSRRQPVNWHGSPPQTPAPSDWPSKRVAPNDRQRTGFEYAQVIEQLKTVFDPEIPVNIVDLGLIYACDAHVQADGSYRLDIQMSMTAPGCGMGDILKHDVRSRVQTVPGVSEVNVEVVWDPPWDQARLTDAARLELGLY